MISVQNKKHKVALGDYSYKKDIAGRLFLEGLTPFEIQVLQELLCLGTRFSIGELAEHCGCSQPELCKLIDTFSHSGLIMRQNDTLFVDKELRKYFEFQISTFDAAFQPDLDYFQGLLAKVPISVLPAWYSIPKTSDNIFASIVEKYLFTPKLYETYINELVFDEPLCNKIIAEVFQAPGLLLPAETLRKRLTLSKEKFQECMLLLEFHFVLASSFRLENSRWKEMVSPFSEWHAYCLFLQNTLPKGLPRESRIQKKNEPSPSFEQFRASLQALQTEYGSRFGSVEKTYRDIEKALALLKCDRWILFEDFVRATTVPLGTHEPVTLRRKSKKWQYVLPTYTEEEIAFINRIVFELLVHAGITQCGEYEGKACFTITPFGRIQLDRE